MRVRSLSGRRDAAAPVDIDLAAGGRFQQARDMQQRGFARAATGPTSATISPGAKRHIQAAEHFQLALAFLEAAGDVFKPQHLSHSAAPRPDRAAPPARLGYSVARNVSPSAITTTLLTCTGSRSAGILRQEIDGGIEQGRAGQPRQALADAFDIRSRTARPAQSPAACR